MTDLFVRDLGAGVPIVFVHGSVFDGEGTWARQFALAERFHLLIPDRRGYGGSPDAEREDFAVDAGDIADLLGVGAHLVGHSYGGVVALLAAAQRPEAVRSLTVIEPPAFALVRGQPAVEQMLIGLHAWVASMVDATPEALLISFMTTVGGDPARLPQPLTPALLRGAKMLANERMPDEAEILLNVLAAASFPKLVISGGHSVPFNAICDVLERVLPAERAVIPGRGHAVQMTGGPFNERLAAFTEAAEAAR